MDRDYPDDGGHVRGLEDAGATTYRGEGVIAGPGRVRVTHDGVSHDLSATNIVLAVGSATKMPPIEGIGSIRTWTNKDATGARELPASLLVLGGGPTGVELAQVFRRFGVPVTVVQSRSAAGTHGPSPQLGGCPGGPAARRRGGPARGPRAAGDAGRR